MDKNFYSLRSDNIIIQYIQHNFHLKVMFNCPSQNEVSKGKNYTNDANSHCKNEKEETINNYNTTVDLKQ